MRDERTVQMESAPPPPENHKSSGSPTTGPVPLNHRVLAILWLVIALPAVFLLVRDQAWLRAPPGLDRFRALKLEQGVALVIVLIQFYLFVRAHLERTVEKINREEAARPADPPPGDGGAPR